MPKIGAHVSAAGSISFSIDKALNMGASCTQIFITPPQRWLQKQYSDTEILEYKNKVKESGIGPNFNHGVYLVNLGTSNGWLLNNSIEWLKYSMDQASKLGLRGTIFHLGSGKEKTFEEVLDQVVNSLKQVLKSDSKSFLILENSAGAGNTIGDELSELSQIIKKVNDERLKVCIDTQHAFVSGYDIRTKLSLDSFLDEFDREIGMEKLVALHVNDSKTDFNSKKDRHANIGEGFLCLETFRNLVNHPRLQEIPFILEVPGFAKKGPDKENVDILKSLIQV